MRARAVVHRILNELEARNPERIEGLVIRSTGIGRRYCRRVQIGKGRQPLLEDWSDLRIPLRVDAANRAGAVVDVEVARDFLAIGRVVRAGRIGITKML